MAKQKTPPQEFVEEPTTGRRWPLVIEIIEGNRVRGFWVGEPHKSCFIGIEPVADKRGITDRMKRRVRAEAAALAATRESLRNPLPPIPRASKQRAAQAASPEWGTLEWYGNALAAAQDRIRLLESERDALLAEKRERDPVVQYVVEEPGRRASRPRKRASPYAAEFQQWILHAAKRLALAPDADDKELSRAIKEATQTKASPRYLADWIPLNRIAIEHTAMKIREKIATRSDVGNGNRNPQRDVGR